MCMCACGCVCVATLSIVQELLSIVLSEISPSRVQGTQEDTKDQSWVSLM